jgi:hypothetical protein
MRPLDFIPRTEVDTSTIGDDAYGDLPAPLREEPPEPGFDYEDDARDGMAVIVYVFAAWLLLIAGIGAAIWWRWG